MITTTNTDVMFFHGRTIDNYRFTIAGVRKPNNTLSISIAVCGNNDLFSKATGRRISMGRVLNQRNEAHQLNKPIPSGVDKLMSYFTNDVSIYNEFTKKGLLKTFGLYHQI